MISERIEASKQRLASLQQLDVSEHPAVFAAVHEALRDELNNPPTPNHADD